MSISIINQYYVYVYLDPRKPGDFNYEGYQFKYEPFYIGEGHKYRINDHLKSWYLKKYTNKFKTNIINKIIKETNKNPIVIKYKENLTEQEALNLEVLMIKTIGRRDLKLGPLVNLTDGGEGTRKVVYSKKQRVKQSNRMKLLWQNDDYKLKQSQSHVGIPQSQQTRDKRAKALLGNSNNGIGRIPWNKGLKTSVEVRMKQSLAKKGKPSPKKGKKYS